MSKKEDFYKVLGVERSCTDDEIKKAYRKLAMKWHPDKHVNDSTEDKKIAEDKFKDINQAYEVLSNSEMRKKYNAVGIDGFSGNSSGPDDFQFHDASDIFESFFKSFGKGRGGLGGFPFGDGGMDMSGLGGLSGLSGLHSMSGLHGAKRSGSKSRFNDSNSNGTRIFIDPKSGQAIRINTGGMPGSSSQAKHNTKPKPSNFGFDDENESDDDSKIIKDEPIIVDLELTLEELYNGVIKKRKITRTIKSRQAERNEEKVVVIEVKPGWKEGTKIKFDGIGDVNPGREPADLIFIVKQKSHKDFKRIDNNLSTIVEITQAEAISGFEKTVRDISGNDLVISLKKGIPNSSYVHTIKGHGMPIRKEGRLIGHGDLLVGFVVKYK